jgi:hypothetical protein
MPESTPIPSRTRRWAPPVVTQSLPSLSGERSPLSTLSPQNRSSNQTGAHSDILARRHRQPGSAISSKRLPWVTCRSLPSAGPPDVPICARGYGAMAGLSSEHSVCINQADRSALCRRWVRVLGAGGQRLTGIETEASVLTGGCVSPPLGGPSVIGCDITPFQRDARALVASGSSLTSVVPVDSARRRSRS